MRTGYRNVWANKAPLPRTCEQCGTTFESVTSAARFCSKRCGALSRPPRKRAARRRTPEQNRAIYERQRDDPAMRAKWAEKQRQHVAKLRAFLDEYKITHGCADCGYNANPLALQFDHDGPMKNRDVSRCRSIRAAQAEIALCVVRCANCHHIKTHERRRNGWGNVGGHPGSAW